VKQYLRSDEGKVMIRSLAEQKLLLCNAPTTHDQGKKYHTESDGKNKRYNKIEKCGNIFFALNNSRLKNTIKYKKELRDMEFFLKKEFLNMEIKEKVEKVKIINGKIETVMKNWMGLSLETIFVKWMQITQNNKWQLKKYSHERCKEERLKYDNDMFVYELAQKKVRCWEKKWDEFNDIPYWINAAGEINRTVPLVESYLPPNWKYPILSTHILDENSRINIKTNGPFEAGTNYGKQSHSKEGRQDKAQNFHKEVHLVNDESLPDTIKSLNTQSAGTEAISAALRVLERKRAFLK